MATHSTSWRQERRHGDVHRASASAASVLLVLRADRDASGGDMAATAEPSPSLSNQQGREEKQADDRQSLVHEVTESSSDESADEEQAQRSTVGAAGPGAKAVRAVIPRSPTMEQEEKKTETESVVVQEYYPTRNVADMVYLFTNDRLKEQPATVVLRSDPYCIPRATDNVTEYRPRFNPLSILEAEEKLLPGHFRLDPAEGVPGSEQAATGASSIVLPLPAAAAASAGSTGVLIGKSTAFMGSMPRQQEFMEFPISESIFHSFKTAPPPPTSPHHGLFASKLYHGVSVAEAADSIRDSTSPALADAVLLSSMHHAADSAAETLETFFPSSASTLEAQPVAGHLPSRHAAGEYFLDDMAAGYGFLGPSHSTDASSAIPSLFVDDVDSSASTTTTASMATATTPHHNPKTRRSLQPVSKKPRAKNVFRQCSAPGCVKGARGKSGLCQRHGGGRRCSVPECPKGAQGSTKLCLFHGGGYRCSVDGCMTGARGTSGLCAKHGGYKGAKDSGAESGGEGGAASAAPPKAKRAKK